MEGALCHHPRSPGLEGQRQAHPDILTKKMNNLNRAKKAPLPRDTAVSSVSHCPKSPPTRGHSHVSAVPSQRNSPWEGQDEALTTGLNMIRYQKRVSTRPLAGPRPGCY